MPVEDRRLDVGLFPQAVVQIDEVAVVAGAEERLVERCQTLLAIEHELERRSIERRRVLHFARRERIWPVRHEEETSGREGLCDRLDERLRFARLPDEV